MNAFAAYTRTHPTVRLFAALLVLLGGAGPVSAQVTDPGGGIGGTGITGFGVVQKFGSIFVNGREFFFDKATRVTRDGLAIDRKALQLGDVVNVQGRLDPASGRSIAAQVDAELALQGTVQELDAESGTLTVLGQTVHVTHSTLGPGLDQTPLLAQLRRGELVAISGLPRAGGSWSATRIAPAAAGEARFVLRGDVQTIDRELGRLTVAGQELIAPSGVLPAQLKVGNIVRVAGRYEESGLRAEGITAARLPLGPAGRVVEMSGYVQTPPAGGHLVSNGVVLSFSDASRVIGGIAAELKPDVPVAVRGTLQADGSIAVHKIQIDVDPMDVNLPAPEVQVPHAAIGPDPADRAGIEKPDDENPAIDKPEIEKPEIERPSIDLPDVQGPDIQMGPGSQLNQ